MIRVGAIEYLNAQPLLQGLGGDPGLELSYGSPADLARWLEKGAVDVALVPVAACFAAPDLRILPGIGIASFGPVESILLLGRADPARARVVGLDEGSRTSASLARILYRIWSEGEAVFETVPPDITLLERDRRIDAILLIGDAAFRAGASGYARRDLGEEWTRITGLPFVYAVWACREGVSPGLSERLARAREEGIACIPRIASEAAPRLGVPPERCERYLAEVIHYDLGPETEEGMRWFLSMGIHAGIFPRHSAIRYLA